MADNKTVPTKAKVSAFLGKLKDLQVREDCLSLVKLMQDITHLEPVMWGSSIVGFGTYHYVYERGREGDTMLIGFSPRKANISIYLMGAKSQIAADLPELGKYKQGGGCTCAESAAAGADLPPGAGRRRAASRRSDGHRRECRIQVQGSEPAGLATRDYLLGEDEVRC